MYIKMVIHTMSNLSEIDNVDLQNKVCHVIVLSLKMTMYYVF